MPLLPVTGVLLTPEQSAAEREAACAEMRRESEQCVQRARCGESDQDFRSIARAIRSLPLPTSALQRALAQARLEEAKYILKSRGGDTEDYSWLKERIAELQRLTETP